jgi:hypothetical protein
VRRARGLKIRERVSVTSRKNVTVALNHLVRLGIAKEVTGKRRARLFGYSRYLKILSEGTEPIQQ